MAYDCVILDCDGVILDSNEMKVHAFQSTALSAGVSTETVREFSRWQRNNFGVSRYRVFETLLSGKFGKTPDQLSADQLVRIYANQVRKEYLSVPETEGLRRFLDQMSGVQVFVASGSDERELREVLEMRGLAEYFVAIKGSPTSKMENVSQILTSSGAKNVLLIGDAHADADAASSNSIDFIFLSGYSMVRDSMLERSRENGFSHFESLMDLQSQLQMNGTSYASYFRSPCD